mgnify:FL=1
MNSRGVLRTTVNDSIVGPSLLHMRRSDDVVLSRSEEDDVGRQPTTEDVARKYGVSRALVSIVFRQAPGTSEETRAKVFAAAERMGYRHNLIAARRRLQHRPDLRRLHSTCATS